MSKRTLTRIALVAGVFALGFFAGEERGKAARKPMVYELRTYYTHPGKLDDLLARFRNHTTKIFERHGMKNLWYGVPQDAPKKDNTLVYMLAHESREAAKKSWDEFRADPEWKKVQAASEANGKIVEKVETIFLDPTDFSTLK